MNIKYFHDTDTALLEFSNHPVEQTREISENIYVDLDREGNLVSMTIEHAQASAESAKGSSPGIQPRRLNLINRIIKTSSTRDEC